MEWFRREQKIYPHERLKSNKIKFHINHNTTTRLFGAIRMHTRFFHPQVLGNPVFRLEHEVDGKTLFNCTPYGLPQEHINYDTIRAWLLCCDTVQDVECMPRNTCIPCRLRVIHCDTRTIVPLPEENMGYTALSYVWGKPVADGNQLDTLEGNIPRLIEDAIRMTKELGFDYLWIDRYCIPQGNTDEARMERHAQIQSMDIIYASSRLTLVAAAGDSPYYGLPGISARKRKLPLQTRIGEDVLIHYVNPLEEIEHSVWNSRGWTYQEWIFSSRKLVFTDNQVYFQCYASRISDLAATILPANNGETAFFATVDTLRMDPAQHIPDGIETVFGRHFSYEEDILNALAGIFSAYGVKHILGLPIYSNMNTDWVHGGWRALVQALEWKIPGFQLERREAFPT